MELNAETLSYLVNVVVLPLLGFLLVRIRRYSPKLLIYASQLAALRKQIKTVLGIIDHINAITATWNKSIEDGYLDPSEAETVLLQINNLVNSPDVKKLREELST